MRVERKDAPISTLLICTGIVLFISSTFIPMSPPIRKGVQEKILAMEAKAFSDQFGMTKEGWIEKQYEEKKKNEKRALSAGILSVAGFTLFISGLISEFRHRRKFRTQNETKIQPVASGQRR